MLTKSNYLWGLQCPKMLWIAVNNKDRIPEPDISAKYRFETGDLIGELATKVFDKGIDLSGLDFKDNLEKTKEALNERKPIFEAGILVDNLFSRADILFPIGEDEWDIFEVKSSTDVKEINIHDVSFQKHVYEKSGLKVRNCFLMHINNQYVKDGSIEPSELFIQADITEKVDEFIKDIDTRIENMFKIIKGDEPDFQVSDLLDIEYDNICSDEFMDNLPDENIFQFFRMFKKKCVALYQDGHVHMKDVPTSVKLNEKQAIQKRLAHEGGKHVNEEGIINFIDSLKYPIYYLDFETFAPAIPRFDGTKPYQRNPFQYSLHIEREEGAELEHVSFLADGTSDPRPKFLQSLKENLGDKGSILVYNQGFEKGVLKESVEILPEFKKWYEENILGRIKDLWDVFKDFSYYDPKQKGSTSLKYVLPVLSDLKYDHLDINNGILASLEYERVTFGDVPESEREEIRKHLEKYCELDTFAEVEILKNLREIIK